MFMDFVDNRLLAANDVMCAASMSLADVQANLYLKNLAVTAAELATCTVFV